MERPVGLGCMRLSTDVARDDARALDVLTAALAAGIDLLDTADAYAHDHADVGHNEHLIARAVAASGRRPVIVTKGGITRPDGAWVPNGRARHLARAARASRERLGVDALDLYLLHAIDPQTPLATSVRALAKLRDDGVARAIGLSNITPTQLDEALAIAPIDAVEVELQPWNLDALHGGLVARCAERDIRLLAHRPFGGPAGARRIARDPLLAELAAQHAVAPHVIVLAWLRALAPVIVPLPGASRVASAHEAARAAAVRLDPAALAALAARFVAIGDAPAHAAPDGSRELVVILGMPASGKSTLAEDFVARGYARFNRDERGGTLLGLARLVDAAFARGTERVVVDNTYATRASRAPLVEIARRHGAALRVIEMTTPLEHAQANAVERMLARHGRLLGPAELRLRAEIPPGAQFRWRREYEPPKLDEGFASIEERRPARGVRGQRRALVVELDDVVWRGRPHEPDPIELLPGARAALAAWRDHAIAGTTWQPGLTADAITRLHDRLRALLDLPIELLACTHPAGPPVCWCRKPLPGLALAFARAHDVDLARSVHVGRGPADRGFALRAGLPYADVSAGWPTPDDALPVAAQP